MNKPAPDTTIEIGGVARAHGIHGEVSITTHDPDSETLGRVESVIVGGVERKILEARNTPQRGWLVLFEGITTRTEAEALRGQVVEIPREALELAEGDVLLHDLIGCKVQLRDGTPWGEVVEIETGFQDRLVIRDGDVERLLPLVDELVPDIDLDAGIVTVDPPEGLPELKLTK